MNKISIMAVCAVASLVCACSRTQDAGEADSKVLTVSIEPQRQILEQLAGPSFTVHTLLSRGSNPESFDPSTGDRLSADKSNIYFGTGVLPFEDRLAESLRSKYVDTSAGVEFIYGTHAHHHGHSHDEECSGHKHGHGSESPDPHYWSSVTGARVIARNMASALIEHMPDSAEVITGRFEALMAHYDSVSVALDEKLQPSAGTTFAVWHPSLSYFARDYALTQLSLGTEGKELSAKGLREAIDRAREAGVKVLFFQQEYDSRQAEPLSEGIGARLVPINPLAYDWEGQLNLVADELAGAQ